jgi:hypothetical protein
VTICLELDSDGNLWLVQEGEIAVVDTLLGPVGDPATSYRVPGELLGEWGRLEVAWAEAVAFGRSCRDEAIDTYNRGIGAR